MGLGTSRAAAEAGAGAEAPAPAPAPLPAPSAPAATATAATATTAAAAAAVAAAVATAGGGDVAAGAAEKPHFWEEAKAEAPVRVEYRLGLSDTRAGGGGGRDRQRSEPQTGGSFRQRTARLPDELHPRAGGRGGEQQPQQQGENGEQGGRKRAKKQQKRRRDGGGDEQGEDNEGGEARGRWPLRLCDQFAQKGTCSFGERCRFSHDVQSYLATKPPDIGPRCHVFDTFGVCAAGVRCRFGSSHIDPETMRSVKREETVAIPPTINRISMQTQRQLKSGRYPFRTVRVYGNQQQKQQAKKRRRLAEDRQAATSDAVSAASFAHEEEKDNEIAGEPTAEAATAATAAAAAGAGSASPTVGQREPRRPIKLVDFSNKVYVAPLTTVGNLPFRRVMKEQGVDITCGEMAVTSSILRGMASELVLLHRHASEDIFGVQLAGGHADQFAQCAELIEEHMQVDFVDLNLGCPIPGMVERGYGSALMKKANRMQDIVRDMTDILSVPITVKMRTGWSTGEPIAHQLVPKIQQVANGRVAAIMVHGRSRLQRYTKVADWGYVAKRVVEAQNKAHPDIPALPVIGNGDILSHVEWEAKRAAYPELSSCCMLARGALIKPWLAREIKEHRHWDISATERLDIFKQFVNFGLEHWGSDDHGVNTTRRFLLEWLSFSCRYVPVGLLEHLPQTMNMRPPSFMGRNDLETLLGSPSAEDWVKISEMLLGPVPAGFSFVPKHRANAYPSAVSDAAASAQQQYDQATVQSARPPPAPASATSATSATAVTTTS